MCISMFDIEDMIEESGLIIYSNGSIASIGAYGSLIDYTKVDLLIKEMHVEFTDIKIDTIVKHYNETSYLSSGIKLLGTLLKAKVAMFRSNRSRLS